MRNKLLALNLAFLIIFISSIPVFATQNDVYNSYTNINAGYNIVVDGNSFFSLYDARGNGWEYKADGNLLFLNGYSGSGIRASGDLVIYAEGINEVSGYTGMYYGSNGIKSSGDIEIIVTDGTTYISGGDGYSQGADGIYSRGNTSIYTFEGASLFVDGGDTEETKNSGGDAILGETVSLSGYGFVRATGGNGTLLYNYGCGGCGIIGNNVYIHGSCELTGGSGYYGGSGINFSDYCETGIVNTSIYGGNGLYGYAIQNSEGLNWNYNDHTIVSGDLYSIKISIRQYILKLFGCGGTRGPATFETLESYYPTNYNLSEYIFQRTGYTQVGWTNTSGNLMQINSLYTPDKDTYLYAEWAPNTYKITYNSNGGSGSMNSSVHTYDISQSLTDCAFSKEGYTFAGWSTSSNGNVEYSNRESIINLTSTNDGTVILYAVWEKSTPYTQIKKVAENSYNVELFNIDSGCTVIFATYQKGKLVESCSKIYNGNVIPFDTLEEFDTIKVMVWNNSNNIKPICKANTTVIE